MLISVLLHVGGLLTVIIVSIVVSIFSSRKKGKKEGQGTGTRPTLTYAEESRGQVPGSSVDPGTCPRDSCPRDSEESSVDQESPRDSSSDSEYSLKDKEAAKRAIIYSEILKPKF